MKIVVIRSTLKWLFTEILKIIWNYFRRRPIHYCNFLSTAGIIRNDVYVYSFDQVMIHVYKYSHLTRGH